jgi:hypothetical protein
MLPKRKGGYSRGSIVTLIIILIAVIAVMGYFGISVQRDVVGNPTIQSNFSYVWTQISVFWNAYLKDLAIGLWRWAIINVTNLPVGSGNGIPIPHINWPVDISNLSNPINALQNPPTTGR